MKIDATGQVLLVDTEAQSNQWHTVLGNRLAHRLSPAIVREIRNQWCNTWKLSGNAWEALMKVTHSPTKLEEKYLDCLAHIMDSPEARVFRSDLLDTTKFPECWYPAEGGKRIRFTKIEPKA